MDAKTRRIPPIAPEAFLAIGLVLLAGAVRFLGFGLVTHDYTIYLRPWGEFITAHGGVGALKYDFANYNVPYLYALVGLTWLGEHTAAGLLTWIKLFSCLFDGVLAFYAYKLVSLRHRGWRMPLLAGLTVLLLPTVVLDSAYWGQCDSIYTAFALAGLYHLLRGRPWLGCALVGVAFAVKLQAIFVFPALLVLLLVGRLPWRALLAIPAVCVLFSTPAWLIGRPAGELLKIYVQQTGDFDYLVLNAPTVWSFVSPTQHRDELRTAGVLFTGIAFLVLIFVVLARRIALTDQKIIVLAATSAIMAPFLLPSMHERYFFMADVLSVVAAFWVPRRLWFVPALLQSASFLTYSSYLFVLQNRVDLRLLTVLVIAALLTTLAELLRRDPAPKLPRPRTPGEPAALSRPGEKTEPLPTRPA
nr:glycosyltransferase 87 family protein [uncultured Actinoplanes sp.]